MSTKRILIVDDEPDILEFTSYSLRREGYEVATADNGKKGLAKALEFRPHLILLDIMMPVMDGMEMCRTMRTDSLLHNSVVLFLSAVDEELEQRLFEETEADGYISKPISMSALREQIDEALTLHADRVALLDKE